VDKGQLSPEEALSRELAKGNGPKYARFALACISGAIPLAGGVVGGVGGMWSEEEQAKINRMFQAWIRMQADEIKEIGKTLEEVMVRLDFKDQTVQNRVESAEYMSLVNKAFRDWSAAESESRRVLLRNILAGAAASRLCSDDVVRLFIEWIARYSDGHFAVLRAIYQTPGSTRGDVWEALGGGPVREDSADADLFKLYFHDLSVGRVIRQHRDTDGAGNFLRKRTRTKSAGRTMASAFDDDKEYGLTQLGEWFVSYAMNELVPKIGGGPAPSAS
jgi:hypothetical protein